MVQVVKFSQFNSGGTLVAGQTAVGLGSGNNLQFAVPPQFVDNFTTGTQPSPATAGMIGYATDINAFQYYNGTSWLTLDNQQALDAFIAELASYSSGQGASLVGLQNQSGVTSQTVQNLANAAFIVQTNNGAMQNAQALGSLTTGILKSTTSTGIVSISAPLTSIDSLSTAANETIYTTGSNTYATTALTSLARTLLSNTTTAAMQSTLGLGSAATYSSSYFLQVLNNLGDLNNVATARINLGLGQAALKSVSNNSLTSLASVSGSFTVGHVLLAADTSGTIKDGGSPAGMGTVLSVQTGTGLTGGPITTTGSIEFANVNNNTILSNISGSGNEPPIPNLLTNILDSVIDDTQGDILYRGASVWTYLPAGTSGYFLQTQGASANPQWAVSPGSGTVSSGLENELAYYAADGTTVSGLATGNSGVLITSSGGVPSISSTLPGAVQGNITALGTIATGVWHGTVIGATYGGTGIDNGSSTITLGGSITFSGAYTTTLTVTNTTSITLPTSGTLLNNTLASADFYVGNGSNVATGVAMSGDATLANTGAVTVSSIGGVAISLAGSFTTSGAHTVTQTYTGNTSVTFPTSGTLATTSQLPTPAALTESNDTNVTLTLGGTPSTALLQAVSITAGWTGTLSLARGGTAANLTAAAGGVPYSTASALALTSAGTSGQLFQSAGTSAPGWTTNTFPSTDSKGDILYASAANTIGGLSIGSTGNILTVASGLPAWTTATYPSTTTINQLLYSSANNTVTGLATLTTAVLTTSSGVPTWASELSLALGGTNADLTASNGGIFYSTASAGAILAGTATAGLALLSGASTTPSWSSYPPITRVVVQTFAGHGTYTYTPTSGMKYATCEVVGSGGGGGGVASSTGAYGMGGGGGGGGYSRKTVTATTIGASQTITIGQGGAGGTAGANNGSSGNTSSVGSIVTASGGSGGMGVTASATAALAAGGGGGIGASGDFNITGTTGMQGVSNNLEGPTFGNGGGTYFGGINPVSGANVTGTAGNNYGVGGSGANSFNNATNYAGGAGSDGIVIITEYVSS